MPREVRETSSTGGQKGVKLSRADLLPVESILRLAELFGRGAKKYDFHQWRQGYPWSSSINSIFRHWADFTQGLDWDVCSNRPDECVHEDPDRGVWDGEEPDTCWTHTGAHHLDCIAWHAVVLREFIETHPGHDDRYIIRSPDHKH